MVVDADNDDAVAQLYSRYVGHFLDPRRGHALRGVVGGAVGRIQRHLGAVERALLAARPAQLVELRHSHVSTMVGSSSGWRGTRTRPGGRNARMSSSEFAPNASCD